MTIVAFILLLALIYLYFLYAKYFKAAGQNAAMVLAYGQMLYFLMEQHKFKEEDYIKLVATMWEIDANVLVYHEFNKKWEAICKALQIQYEYTDTYKTTMSEKVI